MLGEPLKNIFVIVDAQNSLALTSRVTFKYILTLSLCRPRETAPQLLTHSVSDAVAASVPHSQIGKLLH